MMRDLERRMLRQIEKISKVYCRCKNVMHFASALRKNSR